MAPSEVRIPINKKEWHCEFSIDRANTEREINKKQTHTQTNKKHTIIVTKPS